VTLSDTKHRATSLRQLSFLYNNTITQISTAEHT